MADAFTGTSAQAALVQAAVDRYVRAQLRHTPQFRMFADTRPVQVDKPGSSVALYKYPNLAGSTSTLSETTDADSVALGDPTAVTITLNEYGQSTITTIRLKNFSFSDIDPNQVDQVAWAMRDSIDSLVSTVLNGGTNVIYAGNATSTISVENTDTIDATDVRKAVTTLRRNAAQGRFGDTYAAIIHPDVSFDLRSATDAAGWRDSHKYAAPGEFWPGEVGTFEGAKFIETARAKVAADGTDATPDANVYRTLFLGKEALAEAVAVEPGARIGVLPDRFNRFFPLGWYGMLGWARFREEALVRVESGSSFNA